MATISIIVPVYNAEEYVAHTLDSLTGQTHSDLEIICVDDGSRDSSLNILREYASRDARILVFSQENGGVSAARNTAMSHATGDILMFVDADDTLVPDACEKVASIFQSQHPEVLTFGLACDPPEAAPATLRRELTPPAKTYNGFKSDLLFKDNARPYACRTAISREFAEREGVRFEPGIALGEDQVFYFAVYPFSRKTVLIPDQLYVYRMNDASATHASTDGRERLLKKLDQHLMVIEAISRIWAERGLRHFCSEEYLEWCMAFLMLDVSKLPPQDQRPVYQRLTASLSDLFGRNLGEIARRIPTKRCLADIQSALKDGGSADKPVVNSMNLVVYYLMYRGFVQCAERVLMRLGLVK